MTNYIKVLILATTLAVVTTSCKTAYKATPIPFKSPSSYTNAQNAAGSVIGARAFVDKEEAEKAFGFNVRGAGLLPVQVAIDNQSSHPLQLVGPQTFLEDNEGNVWPVLTKELASQRTTKYVQTKSIYKEGAYGGLLGAATGAMIGGAIGVVSGNNVGSAAGKGAVVGGVAGTTIGGVKGSDATGARKEIIEDVREKSLESKPVQPGNLGYGFIFFPGEAKSAKELRLKLIETDTKTVHQVLLSF